MFSATNSLMFSSIFIFIITFGIANYIINIFINSREAVADTIGDIVVFYNPGIEWYWCSAILQFKKFELFWCAAFFLMICSPIFSSFLKSNWRSYFDQAETGSGTKKRVDFRRKILILI